MHELILFSLRFAQATVQASVRWPLAMACYGPKADLITLVTHSLPGSLASSGSLCQRLIFGPQLQDVHLCRRRRPDLLPAGSFLPVQSRSVLPGIIRIGPYSAVSACTQKFTERYGGGIFMLKLLFTWMSLCKG